MFLSYGHADATPIDPEPVINKHITEPTLAGIVTGAVGVLLLIIIIPILICHTNKRRKDRIKKDIEKNQRRHISGNESLIGDREDYKTISPSGDDISGACFRAKSLFDRALLSKKIYKGLFYTGADLDIPTALLVGC